MVGLDLEGLFQPKMILYDHAHSSYIFSGNMCLMDEGVWVL